MRLRRLLTSLGLEASGPRPDADPFLRRLQEQLHELGPERLEYLAGFAGQLARVAEAEDGISAAEAAVITTQLRQHGHLDDTQARIVVDLLRHEFEVLRNVQHHMLNRAVNAHATPAEKVTLIDCLYAVAAADRLVTDVEEQEIRLIANALLLSHAELMNVRGRYRDRIESLQLMKRVRQPSKA